MILGNMTRILLESLLSESVEKKPTCCISIEFKNSVTGVESGTLPYVYTCPRTAQVTLDVLRSFDDEELIAVVAEHFPNVAVGVSGVKLALVREPVGFAGPY